MKTKTTKSAIKNRYNNIICVGYGDAQFLLNFINPFAYSTRSEGWACDYYNIDGVIISTGYAPLTDKNTKHNYETIKKYDNQARNIIYNYNLTYEEQKKQVNALLNEFISKCVLDLVA